jgi:hypothetical protein
MDYYIKEVIEVELHPNNMDKKNGICLGKP